MGTERVKSKSWVGHGTGELFLGNLETGIKRKVALHIKSSTPIDAYKAMKHGNKMSPIQYSNAKYEKIGNFKIGYIKKGNMVKDVRVYRRRPKVTKRK